jgi:hypothetical protein
MASQAFMNRLPDPTARPPNIMVWVSRKRQILSLDPNNHGTAKDQRFALAELGRWLSFLI